MIQDYIQDKKNIVLSFLSSYKLKTALPLVTPINSWGTVAINKLFDFTASGKMLRAALVYIGSELSTTKKPMDMTPIAAAMELFQSGILIHDDIADNDDMRRGKKSMHIQFKDLTTKSVLQGYETGKSMALMIGDLSQYLGFDLLSQESIPQALQTELHTLFSQELVKVSIAQMADIYGGGMKRKTLTKKEILAIYRYKTGRYSCGLPLVAGALTAGVNTKTIEKLWEFGELAGIVFQLTDDKLNIFGDPKKTGKSMGSDIREGKQTLLCWYTYEKAQSTDLKRIDSIYGNPQMKQQDVLYVQSVMKNSGALADCNTEIDVYTEKMQHVLTLMEIPEKAKTLLQEFIHVLGTRSH